MTKETKGKLEAEERRHAEEMSRLLTEKESGWLSEPTIRVKLEANRVWLESDVCLSSMVKAIGYAKKIELFLRMQKWADENNGELDKGKWSLYIGGASLVIYTSPAELSEPMNVYYSSEEIAKKAREKFGPDILKLWGSK